MRTYSEKRSLGENLEEHKLEHEEEQEVGSFLRYRLGGAAGQVRGKPECCIMETFERTVESELG